MLTRAFRKLFFDNFLSPSTENCIADLDSILVRSAASAKKKDETCLNVEESNVAEAFIIDESDYRVRDVEEHFMSTNALTYVAGYLLKRCLQNHQCKVCSEFVIHLTTTLFSYSAILNLTMRRKDHLAH